MSALANIQSRLAPEMSRLNSLICDTLHSSNAMMNGIVDKYLQTKGKQIRPMLVILSSRLYGDASERVISAAAAVELLHNASLIHDDVVDETKMRRNSPTINGVWDNHIAVLVGDFFVASSLQRAIDTADMRVIDCVARLGRQLSVGELDQLNCAKAHSIDEDAYLSTIQGKTASLFTSCVEIGAYASGAPLHHLDNVAEFARLLGLCFQIKDDIFDYFGNDHIGKPTGNDLREGKITLPLLHVLSTDQSPYGEAMRSLSRREELAPADIDTLIRYAVDNGGIEYAYSRMQQIHDQAMPLLDPFVTAEAPASVIEAVDSLREIFDYTIHRDY